MCIMQLVHRAKIGQHWPVVEAVTQQVLVNHGFDLPVSVFNMSGFIGVSGGARAHTHTHTHTHTQRHIRARARARTRLHTLIDTSIHTRAQTHMYVHVHAHARSYTHTLANVQLNSRRVHISHAMLTNYIFHVAVAVYLSITISTY